MAWDDKGDYDKAIADYTEAIRLEPNEKVFYKNRGTSWYDKSEYDKAIADYTEAIRLNPKDVIVYCNRGKAWENKGVSDKAIADFTEAIRLDPKSECPYSYLSWLYATCTDEMYRDGKKAIENGVKACELTGWKDDEHIDTLAAAYAENGQFEKAILWLDKAIQISSSESDKSDYESRLELYKSGKPYRQPKK